MLDIDTPVFDRANELPRILSEDATWQPPRAQATVRGTTVRLASDGPTVEWRLAAQAARLTSNAFSGQAANDNTDWPLQKLLRAEDNAYCLALAERYRDLHDTANRPIALVGNEAENLYFVQNVDAEGNDKGAKVIKGRNALVETQPRRNLAAPVPKKWTGDWPILASIDARRELAILRAHLGFVPKILDAFEWSVVDGLTLEQIGKRLGAGSKGAKGEARARVFDGFGIVDRFWRLRAA